MADKRKCHRKKKKGIVTAASQENVRPPVDQRDIESMRNVSLVKDFVGLQKCVSEIRKTCITVGIHANVPCSVIAIATTFGQYYMLDFDSLMNYKNQAKNLFELKKLFQNRKVLKLIYSQHIWSICGMEDIEDRAVNVMDLSITCHNALRNYPELFPRLHHGQNLEDFALTDDGLGDFAKLCGVFLSPSRNYFSETIRLVIESKALLRIVKVLNESCYRLHLSFQEICQNSGFLQYGRKLIMKKKSCEDRRLVKNPPRTKKFRRQRRIDAARSKKYFLLHLGIPKSKSHNYSRKRNRKMKNFGNFRESDPQVKNYRCDPSKRYSQKKTRRPPVASSKSKRGVSQRHVKMPQSSGQSSGETVRPATHVQHSTMIFRDTSTGIFKPTVIATLNPQNLRTKNEKQRQKSTKNVWKNSLHFLFGRSIQHSRCQTPKNPTRGKRSSAKKKSVSDKCRENDTNGFLLPVQWPLYDLLNGGTLKYRPLYCR